MILNPVNHWKLGLFVVGALAMGFGALAYLGADRLSRESFEVVSFFSESVEGLDVGSPVKYRGVTLGRVQEITFAPNRTDVAVTSEIFFEKVERLGLLEQLPSVGVGLTFEIEGLRVQLARSGITGIAFLEADIFDAEQFPLQEYEFPLPWNHVPSTQSTLESLEGTLTETLEELPRLVRTTEAFVQRLDRSVEALEVEVLRDDARATLASMRQLSEELRGLETTALVGELRSTVADARTLIGDLAQGVEPIGPAVEEVRGVAAVAREELERTGVSVREASARLEGLGSESSALVYELRGELVDLGATLEAVRRLAELLERDPAALLTGRDD